MDLKGKDWADQDVNESAKTRYYFDEIWPIILCVLAIGFTIGAGFAQWAAGWRGQ